MNCISGLPATTPTARPCVAASNSQLAPRRSLAPRALLSALFLLAFLPLVGCAGQAGPRLNPAQVPPPPTDLITSGSLSGVVPSYEPINDPIERTNRGLFVFNDQFTRWLARPVEAGYRFLFPKPARTHITQMSNNLAWPVHLFTNLLQGQFKNAGVVTGRFLVNTTVGILGLFDPAQSMGMHPHPSDFGTTFYKWGAGFGGYFVFPLSGPSSFRDTGGWVGDTAFDIATYVPGLSTFFSINDLSFRIDDYMRLTTTESDPYAMTRDLWAANRSFQVMDYQLDTSQTAHAPTLKAVFLRANNPKFYKQATTRWINVPTTGRDFPYSCWIQPHPAPLIYILPGTGGHRLSSSAVAMAELAWRHGYSAVTISNTMNWEFARYGSSTALPGYPRTDAADVYAILTTIRDDLNDRYPGRVTSDGMLGLSLGAMHALIIERLADASPVDALHFDRVVAVNPPLDMMYALDRIDQYYNAPLHWPADDRPEHVQNTLRKAVAMAQGDVDPTKDLPFTRDEAHYLIGLNFRLVLRDVIYASQQRQNLGLLEHSVTAVKRRPVYQEIMRYSFNDYLERFVIPYYEQIEKVKLSRDEFIRNANLYPYADLLHYDARIHVFTNANDFLLKQGDLEWLQQTFGTRLTVFPDGGHLGNLFIPQVQDQIFAPFKVLAAGNR